MKSGYKQNPSFFFFFFNLSYFILFFISNEEYEGRNFYGMLRGWRFKRRQLEKLKALLVVLSKVDCLDCLGHQAKWSK